MLVFFFLYLLKALITWELDVPFLWDYFDLNTNFQIGEPSDNFLQDMIVVCRDELQKLKKEDPRYSGKLKS